MPPDETLGQRIRRVRTERGMSSPRSAAPTSAAHSCTRSSTGRSQPSTRVLRVIAGRLGTEVDYLLEGRLPGVERELALEKGRVLLARGDALRALAALRPAVESTEWRSAPTHGSARRKRCWPWDGKKSRGRPLFARKR